LTIDHPIDWSLQSFFPDFVPIGVLLGKLNEDASSGNWFYSAEIEMVYTSFEINRMAMAK
jgi:hypothetical protein